MLMWLVFAINTGFLLYCASLFRKKVYNVLVARCKKKEEAEESRKSGGAAIEMTTRTSGIHTNPLKYNKEFAETHETINPLVDASMTVNPIQTARRSKTEKRRTERTKRLKKIRQSRKQEMDVDDDNMVENPMRRMKK